MDVDHAAVLALAQRAGLTGYDASYLHLARVIEVAFVQSQTETGNGAALIGVDHLPASIRGNLGAGYLAPPRNPAKPLDELLTEKTTSSSFRILRDRLARAWRAEARLPPRGSLESP